MSNRFSYVQYDEKAAAQQQELKAGFEAIEALADKLEDGRAKSLVMTKLEEAYMWTGKSIRDSQIKRNGSAPEQPHRNNE
jgi:hypothetical protein